MTAILLIYMVSRFFEEVQPNQLTVHTMKHGSQRYRDMRYGITQLQQQIVTFFPRRLLSSAVSSTRHRFRLILELLLMLGADAKRRSLPRSYTDRVAFGFRYR